MAWSTPPSWAAGNVVTSAKLTIVSDDLNFLFTGAYDAWTSYTPTLTQSGAVTKTVTYAKYAKFGRTVVCKGILSVTGTGTAGQTIAVGLPVTSVAVPAGVHSIGTGIIFDTSATAYYRCLATHATTTAMQFLYTGSTSAAFMGVADFTAALASGDTVSWEICYEAAS